MAKITNNALPQSILSKSSGQGLAFYIAQLWKTVVVVGGLATLLFLVWGGLEWLMSGDDKAKLESAKAKISNAVIGLAVIVISYAVILLLQNIFKINILQPEFPNAL